jgi:hypothetical protein
MLYYNITDPLNFHAMTTHHHHDHHHHHHPAGHGHPPAALAFSILRLSLARRFGMAAGVAALIWLALFFVLFGGAA